jgi:phosphocarrier protein HPr
VSAVASREVVICNEQGMHARPIAMMVATAVKYESRILIAYDGQEVDGRSVLQLMTISAPKGARLALRSEGPDAEEQIAAVAAVVESGFGET